MTLKVTDAALKEIKKSVDKRGPSDKKDVRVFIKGIG